MDRRRRAVRPRPDRGASSVEYALLALAVAAVLVAVVIAFGDVVRAAFTPPATCSPAATGTATCAPHP